ncbi:putative Trypsin [Vibrio nigripulchritudo SFn27]|uniref:Peptidase, trypsin-like serine and cysteine n=2 Tax=Vibrio nigripulchritudo TaxID=28173 RepID=A0A9P1JLP2_9VIBR|nr:trypsin-like serine protease [Vibrio nigripulchritudo]CBJ93239.1 Putative peptidase, trypsin-like serine and cysteine [Vibrio nigripulchritudo]CCN86063.1 putative Trypsin [Vibrio nigripulchritudo BLFn1]CCN92051.1 putative Trypsin [Vibrio nigripulchritudo SFn27]CCN97862.1 putative Trypsin [Vibrio nigripulchritudo ENn2]CCO44085.1 putative Trypsin [Vibrio nigripulchritudo SFn135]
MTIKNIGLLSTMTLAVIGGMYSTPTLAVIQGVDVAPMDASYMVHLHENQCTGALIAPRTVLTAAHCVNSKSVGSEVFLLRSVNADGDDEGTRVKVINKYKPTHLYIIDGKTDPKRFDDIAILELESMPEGASWLPISHQEIPLGAEVYTMGYGHGKRLKKMPVPATIVAKEASEAYHTEARMVYCPNSKYFSTQYISDKYEADEDAVCDWLEQRLEKERDEGIYFPREFSITIKNPALPESHPKRVVNKHGTVVSKYSAEHGDSGGPLIFNDVIYGVTSSVTFTDYSTNMATYYAGFMRPGMLTWIDDTIAKIEHSPIDIR